MKAKLKTEADLTVVRIVPAFKESGGGSLMDVKELSKRINPYVKRQILIAPLDLETPQSYDNSFDYQIIRVKTIQTRYNVPILSWIIKNSIYYVRVLMIIKHIPNVDLIQTHEIDPVTFSSFLGRILHIPVVGMLHGTAEAYSKWAGLCETILAILCRPTYAIVVDSGTRAPEKFRKIWGNRVTVVNHGIDTELYYPKRKNKAILQKLNLTESDLIILSISSLIPIKNIDLAITIFEKIINEISNPRVFLLIAGDGDQKEELVKMVNDKKLNNHVKFLGRINNELMPEYISIADICIGMSLKDNMNRSILEPMACGKPIVAFGGGGIEELIKTGYNGFLAKRGNTIDFEEKIKILLRSPKLRREMGKNAYESILKERSWNTRIKEDLAVYRKAISSYETEQQPRYNKNNH